MRKHALVMVLIGVLSIPATIRAATYDVSPELAREVAYSLYSGSYFYRPYRVEGYTTILTVRFNITSSTTTAAERISRHGVN